MPRKPPELVKDPVDAYDRIAPEYQQISARRQAYLDSINKLVIANVPSGAQSMLDVGAGDAVRSVRIASDAGIKRLTLLEPSAAMRSYWPSNVQAWDIRAEELATKEGSFDIITCLWNVLGHIFPEEARIEALQQIGRLLAPGGIAFVDVSHRYNMRHYGLLRTLPRMLYDLLGKHGDVNVQWSSVCTKGHVFTQSEFVRLVRSTDLRVRQVFSVDYETGEVHRSEFSGHLLYLLLRPANQRLR